jgi:predicted GIY-YIG superfamily endonuclease
MNPDDPHYVYRCFDDQGRLLYIGCTYDVDQRLEEHRYIKRSSFWINSVELTTAEIHPDRASALAAEAAAIRSEQPPFNVANTSLIDYRNDRPNPMFVIDRQTGAVRMQTVHQNKVDWFLALVGNRRRFIVFPDYWAVLNWRAAKRRQNLRAMSFGVGAVA